MSDQTSRVPEGYTIVAPWVVTDDTGAFLDFVTQAFGGEELGRVSTEDGLIGHAEIRVGDTVVLAFDRPPSQAPLFDHPHRGPRPGRPLPASVQLSLRMENAQ